MSTELLLLIEVVATFTTLLFINKFLGKEGLIGWIAIATILANVFTVKSALFSFGWGYTEGTVLFASVFLATDFLTERYGKEVANKGVLIGLISSLALIIFGQWQLFYSPAPWSIEMNEALSVVFGLSLRVTISSVVMYFIANRVDVWLYDKLKKKTKGKHMWLRNNVSTILCNCLENFFFMFGAFLFVEGYDVATIFEMAITTSVVEMLVGLLDTPFLYAGMSMVKSDPVKEVPEFVTEESEEILG